MTIFEWNDALFKIVYEINNIIKIMMPLINLNNKSW